MQRVLRVGLTGGIGSGKSTVSARLRRLGAAVVDADAVAREVVEPGMPALAAITDRFGPAVLTGDGSLDRPGLGRLVFGDPGALRDLEAITHPAIWARTAELISAAAVDHEVVVHDMPLLVEKGMSADYHLVVVVGAGEETRLRRLVEVRGMAEEDARARIAAQAVDTQRRAAADVWLDNEGTTAELGAAVARLWSGRVLPFAANLRSGTPVTGHGSDPGSDLLTDLPESGTNDLAARAAATARTVERVRAALGDKAVRVEAAGGGAETRLRVAVPATTDLDDPGLVDALAGAGFPRLPAAPGAPGAEGASDTRHHGGCDPARVLRLELRVLDAPHEVSRSVVRRARSGHRRS